MTRSPRTTSAIIITVRAIDVCRWAGIGAVLVIALTTLTLRRIARDFIDRDDARGAVIAFVVLVILVALSFSRNGCLVPLVKQHRARRTSVNIMRRLTSAAD